MTVREGTIGDLSAICAIEAASFSDPWSENDFRAAFAEGICEYIVTEDGGKVVGYALFRVLFEDAEIMSLAVDPSTRRAGAGAAMMARLLSRVTERGGQTVFLEVRASNEAAIALYEKLGFARVRTVRRYYRRPIEDAIVMALSLAPDGE